MAITSTAPLRTVLIGLSSSPAGYGWLNHFHLPAIQKHPDSYAITGVLGSSLTRSQQAIQKHDLPPGVKGYGSPEDLAKDADNIDLLVVGVKAPLHYDVLMPALRAGKLKGLFIEWPIGRSLAETVEIVNLAKQQNLRTAVGLQGRYSSVTRRIQQHVSRIGAILSTSATGTIGAGDGSTENSRNQYALDPRNGATMLDIHFAHFLECLTFALDAEVKTAHGLVKVLRPTIDIVDDTSGEVLEKDFPKQSPDQIVVQGLLQPKATAEKGASQEILYSINMRLGNRISGGVTWTIFGTKGEIEISSPGRMVPWINLTVPWKIRVKADGEELVLEDVTEGEEKGQPAVARLCDAFVNGEHGSWPDFDRAVAVHKVVDAVWRSSRDGQVVML
jgi:predicted dehydrogenase